jgi:5-methyltetrahydrofolate--homocysteine methyltransferase
MSNSFLELIQSGQSLIADGATGTNLQARGLERGKSSEMWLLERPEEIIRLHAEFLTAGANLILTCTFGASPLRLEAAGLGGRTIEINDLAVSLARKAIKQSGAGKQRFVAGSIGPTGHLLKPYGPLDEDEAEASYAGQARALDQAGVDLLVIETQFDLKEASLALKAARQASKLPVVVSFSYDRGTRTMMGVKPLQMAEHFAQEFKSGAPDLLGINCGRSLDDNLKALGELRSAANLPLWFKPNAGMPQIDAAGNTSYSVSPAEMGALAPQWLAAGARVVGGCCGTSPEHLAAIASAVGA